MFFAARERELALRRATLRGRCAALREGVVADAHVFAAPLRVADRVRTGWRWLLAHPEAVFAGVVVLGVVRPRRSWTLARWAWRGWRAWQRVRGFAALVAGRRPAGPGTGPAAAGG